MIARGPLHNETRRYESGLLPFPRLLQQIFEPPDECCGPKEQLSEYAVGWAEEMFWQVGSQVLCLFVCHLYL